MNQPIQPCAFRSKAAIDTKETGGTPATFEEAAQ
jgi:hypothetical protein